MMQHLYGEISMPLVNINEQQALFTYNGLEFAFMYNLEVAYQNLNKNVSVYLVYEPYLFYCFWSTM